MKDTQIGIKDGWSKELEKSNLQSLQSITGVSGFFFIKPVRREYYWYFRDNKTKKDIYLGKVGIGFQECFHRLSKKISGEHQSGKKTRKLTSVITEYNLQLEKRGIDINGTITLETARNRINGLNQFYLYCDTNDVRLGQMEGYYARRVYKSFQESLLQKGLARSSIKTYLKSVRLFLEDLSKDKTSPNGWGLIRENVIDTQYQNDLMSVVRDKDNDGLIKEYKDEYYKDVVDICIKKTRELWEDYVNNGGIYYPPTDKNGETNKPNNTLGTDSVYVVSLIQILTGMRLKEVLHSFTDKDKMELHREDNKIPYNRSYSYWSYDEENEIWVATISMKKKKRRIPIREYIYSTNKPPDGVRYIYEPYKKRTKGRDGIYKTDLIDVIRTIHGHNNLYLFPSSWKDKYPDRPRSLSQHMANFRNVMRDKERLDRYGITSTHNLRSYYISYMIRRPNITPLMLSELVGHSIKIMEERYKRENMQSKYDSIMGSNYKSIIEGMKK